MAIVTFDPANFALAYPAFSNVPTTVLQNSFNLATLLCNNTDKSPVEDVAIRETLLWLLVAHISTLNGQTNTTVANGSAGTPQALGRISSATEGSVSISSDYPMSNNSAYFKQTQYGAMYWQMILPYRTFRYRRQTLTII
jgi:hypothetical protein